MSFKKIGSVILIVSEMEKSLVFYKDILGLPIKSQSEAWTEFFVNGTVLALHPAENKTKLKTGISILIGFMVSDLETNVKKLKENKVKFFKEAKEEPFGKHAIIEDPDGHLISVAEINTEPTEGFDLIGLIGVE
ncbi:MAG TPA: VOC family protein [Nitrososphaeraceae archaeon]|nr:VOC family protein [Nitrososphaeraceae archaeon]